MCDRSTVYRKMYQTGYRSQQQKRLLNSQKCLITSHIVGWVIHCSNFHCTSSEKNEFEVLAAQIFIDETGLSLAILFSIITLKKNVPS